MSELEQLLIRINDVLKTREYLKPGQKPPKGVQVRRGSRGALYYDTTSRPRQEAARRPSTGKKPLYGSMQQEGSSGMGEITVSSNDEQLQATLPKFEKNISGALRQLPSEHTEGLRFVIERDLISGTKLGEYEFNTVFISALSNKVKREEIQKGYHNEITAAPWKIITIHEIGHYVHEKLVSREWKQAISKAPEVGATEYAIQGGPSERFAESYLYYVTNPKALEKRDPTAYNFMKDAVFNGHEFSEPIIKNDDEENEDSSLPAGSIWIEDKEVIKNIIQEASPEDEKEDSDKEEKSIDDNETVASNEKLPKYGYGSSAQQNTEMNTPAMSKSLDIKKSHSRTKCMKCDSSPTIEYVWADGRGHAWFCDKHAKEFKDSGDKEIVAIRKIFGVASDKWSDRVSKKEAEEILNKEFGTVASGGFTPCFSGPSGKDISKKISKFLKEYEGMVTPPFDYPKNKKKDVDPCKDCNWRHPDTCRSCDFKVRKATFAPDATDKNQDPIEMSVDKEIKEETTSNNEPKKPKTKLQEKIIGDIDTFEKDIIKTFIKRYERLALTPWHVRDYELSATFDLAKDINIQKEFSIKEPEEIDRLEQVIFIDSVAHNLHKKKYPDGKSIYRELDELADISKASGEENREDRLLLLSSPVEANEKLSDMGIDILYKGKLLDKSISYWRLFEKAIKNGVAKLSNDELILLREWVYSKI